MFIHLFFLYIIFILIFPILLLSWTIYPRVIRIHFNMLQIRSYSFCQNRLLLSSILKLSYKLRHLFILNQSIVKILTNILIVFPVLLVSILIKSLEELKLLFRSCNNLIDLFIIWNLLIFFSNQGLFLKDSLELLSSIHLSWILVI